MRSKTILSGVSLFSYGALVGWAVAGDYLENKYKSSSEAMQEVIERQAKRLAQKSVASEAPVNMSVFFHGDEKAQTETESESEVGDEAGVETALEEEIDNSFDVRERLKAQIEQYVGSAKVYTDEFDRQIVSEGFVAGPPHLITKEQFAWEDGYDHYHKETVIYYAPYRAAVDEDDEAIEDIDALLGWKNLDVIGGDDLDVVYIRNDRIETDYEVVLEAEDPLPAHVQFAMSKEEFATRKASGDIRFRPEDE